MRLVVHGARGSSSVSGPAFAKYGGDTTCYEIQLDGGHRLLIDCGSGSLRLGRVVGDTKGAAPGELTILLTHFHWDHIQGLPFLLSLFAPKPQVRIMGLPPAGYTVASALDGAIRPPWFPVRLSDMADALAFDELTDQPIQVGQAEVTGVALNHPGGVTGYRIVEKGRSLVVATDVEAGEPASDAALLALAKHATLLIHDAQYIPSEIASSRRGWGHSTWQDATAVASAASVERLLLTSHDPMRDDEAVDTILYDARRRFPQTDAAFAGQVIDI